MAKDAVSVAEVEQAILYLERNNQPVTQRSVIAITGGDTGRVSAMIEQLRPRDQRRGSRRQTGAAPAPEPLPMLVQTVIDQAKAALEQLGQEAVAASNQSLQAERDQMQQDMQQLEQDIDDIRQQNIRYADSIQDLQQQIVNMDAEIQRLNSELAAANQAKSDLQAERDTARKDVARLADEARLANEQAAKERQAHAEDLRKLNDQLTTEKSNNAALEQTVKDQQAALGQMQKDLKAAQDAAQTSALNAARLEAENKGLAKVEQTLQAEIKRLEGRVEASGKEVTQRTQELLELHDKHARADHAREEADKRATTAEEARRQMEKELADWKRRAEDAENTIKMQDAQITGKGSKRAAAE